MRRIGRYILNGLTVLSLLLCVATVGLWARSYRETEQLDWRGDGRWLNLTSSRGQLMWCQSWEQERLRVTPYGPLTFQRNHEPRPRGFDADVYHWYHQYPKGLHGPFLGFMECMETEPTWRHHVLVLIVPWWFVTPTSTVLGALGMIRWRRNRIILRGDLCPKCGYDLRATPDCCPECGTIPTKVKA